MKTAAEIIAEVNEILETKWQSRDGRQVPDPDSVNLGNDAVRIDGTVLYADMADSTGLVAGYKDWFVAEVYKSYLVAACHVIRNNSGTITAFDGDRVMAVYMGESKNSSATKTALQLNWAVAALNKALKKHYPSTAFQLRHSVGIDSSKLFVTRTGIRNANDLVWVGRAANYAAKLANLPDTSSVISITEAVYSSLSDSSKFGGNPRTNMWTKAQWNDRNIPIYKSSWSWTVS